jgi:hypothetical protein
MEERERLNRAAAVALLQADIDTGGIRRPVALIPVGRELSAGFADDNIAQHDAEVTGESLDEAVWTVAEALQDLLADPYATVWPLCKVHRIGVHVRAPDGTSRSESGQRPAGHPVWWCSGGGGGGHALAQIGRLRRHRRIPLQA